MTEESLFHEALAKPSSERAAFLDAACAGQPELRSAVEALLAAHEAAGSLLDKPPLDLGETVLSDAGEPQNGATAHPAESHYLPTADYLPRTVVESGLVIAGRYVLQQKIGEGGMGEVWVAKQTEPVKRKVALKLIKTGMDSKAVLQRFEQERQALAIMDHPNIARVLDGGLTPTGQPFFVMELVNGLPLNKFCDEARLTPRQRLELFVPICQAVQHAHQKGIVHRDLKPANILVTMIDSRPVPKVIDFGVAKATSGKLTDESMSTQFGVVVGTLEYMSPEQAGFSGEDIDTRADIYSLGVILYELLTGLRPIDAKRLKNAALVEMIRIIREEDPSKPSTRLSTDESLPSLAAMRQTEPKKLMALLRGELDWLVMKCLEKQRDRRYETANALARDIQRYLADEVVEARPPSVGYRLKKFVRRNKGQVIAASFVLFALLLGMAGTTWGLIEARRQKTELTYRLGISDFLLATAAYDSCDVVQAVERLDNVPQNQRGWEWAYLKRQTNGGIFTLHGHTALIWCVKFSPDGSRIVTGSEDQTAKIWDARTGTLILDLKGRMGSVHSVSFSPDGTTLATGGRGTNHRGEAKVWDALTGAHLLDLKGHTGGVHCVSFSQDGARIVTGGSGESSNDPGEAKVWDASTGTHLLDLKGHSREVRCVSFSPDGSRIVTGSSEKTAKVWDARTGRHLLDLKGHGVGIVDGGVVGVGFSPDGTRIITASEDRTAKVWDAGSGTQLLELKGHATGVYSVSFSPDGTRIVTGSADRTAKVWDARTGMHLLDLKGHTDAVTSVSFSPDGTQIVTGSSDRTAKAWDARTGTPQLDLKGLAGWVSSVSFSPDGTRLLTGVWEVGKAGGTKVWDARTGMNVLDLKGHNSAFSSASFSPDGTRIATNNVDSTAQVWDARTGMHLLDLKGHTQQVVSVSFSPDGSQIVTGGGADANKPGEAKVWDARTAIPLLDLKGHTGPVACVRFSSDGTRIVSCDETAKVWDARTGTLLLDLKEISDGVVTVSFSPDGSRIVVGSANGSAKVCDSRSGTLLLDLKGHKNGVWSVCFSPDGTRIVTGSWDGTAKIWDTRTGTPLLELAGHSDLVWSVTFSPDGTQLATGSRDRTVKVWDAHRGQELKHGEFLNTEELEYRLFHTRPNGLRYSENYEAAHQANDLFTARFYLDRILSLPEYRTKQRFQERNDLQADQLVIARTSFHCPEFSKTRYDRSAVEQLAGDGDRLAQRLLAQELLRDGKPGEAIPMLNSCLSSRPASSPPVEELLLAQAHLELMQPDEAKRFYQAATERLNRLRNPKDGFGVASQPLDDPRRNPFDWEVWHECDVFRAAVEKGLAKR